MQPVNENYETTAADSKEYQEFEVQFARDNSKQQTVGFAVIGGVILTALALLFGSAHLMQSAGDSIKQVVGSQGSAE